MREFAEVDFRSVGGQSAAFRGIQTIPKTENMILSGLGKFLDERVHDGNGKSADGIRYA
jgi:hypothetical protein